MLKLNTSALKYFKKLDYTKAPQMDCFHMCIIIGLHAVLNGDEHLEKLENVDNMESGTFTSKGIPIEYAHNFPATIGLMIEAQFERKRIDKKDEVKVSRLLNTYLNYESNTKLTSEGADLMSRYSYKGFEIISNNIGDQEAKLENRAPGKIKFLCDYYELLEKYIN